MRCPKSGKLCNPSRRAAEQQLASLQARRGAHDLAVYRCGDHFHVGHSPAALSKRIHQALRG